MVKSEELQTPDGWEQHPHMSKSHGYLDAFRKPDHSAFVDIIEYKAHMDARYVVKLVLHVGDGKSIDTETRKSVDCADEAEAWETAVHMMESISDVGGCQ